MNVSVNITASQDALDAFAAASGCPIGADKQEWINQQVNQFITQQIIAYQVKQATISQRQSLVDAITAARSDASSALSVSVGTTIVDTP